MLVFHFDLRRENGVIVDASTCTVVSAPCSACTTSDDAPTDATMPFAVAPS